MAKSFQTKQLIPNPSWILLAIQFLINNLLIREMKPIEGSIRGSPPESPVAQDDYDTQASNAAAAADSQGAVVAQDDDDLGGGGHSDFVHPSDHPSTSRPMLGSVRSKDRIKMTRRGR
uniref:Uncharacterized protein n=1 Tax=Salix viminalis TaxID=40686 RepID=A0A6N2M5B6_SALVM